MSRTTPPAGGPYAARSVARLTGLSLETLRTWERDHRVVTATRGERGRVYTGNDVKRLQLVAAAVQRGHPIARLAPMANAELEALIAVRAGRANAMDSFSDDDPALKALLAALERFDSVGVERELDRLALAFKPREFVRRVVIQFLKRVGDEWNSERLGIAQEHLLSAAIRSLLGAMIKLYRRDDAPKRLLFATASGERHEFGILAAAMLAAAGGLGVVYIGADVPSRQIVDSAARSGVDVVVIGALYTSAPRELQKDVNYLVSHLPAPLELWIGGILPTGVDKSLSARAIVRLTDFDALEAQLVRVGARF